MTSSYDKDNGVQSKLVNLTASQPDHKNTNKEIFFKTNH